jgi:DNA uptake protein ComE-like DNA-binding protein
MNRADNSNPLIFSKADRIAIITIVAVVAVVVGVSYLYPLLQSRKVLESRANLDSLLMVQDVAVVNTNTASFGSETTLTPFDFNPNEMSDQQWEQLGLSERQIKSINNYMSKGGNFKTKNDFAKLYCISEEEYAVLEPYIQLPETYNKPQKKNNYSQKPANKPVKENKPVQNSAKYEIIDLNLADSTQLATLPRINKYLASRIVRYKNSLGNFVDVEQLLEVKGVDTACFYSIAPYLALSQTDVVKMNVNTFEFKSLLKHPYLDYDQVKSIVSHREKRGFITDWDQLCAVLDNKGTINPRLKYYVEF